MSLICSMMLEVLRQDYIMTIWYRVLSEKVIIARHTFNNALIPIVTPIGLQVPTLIKGTVIIKKIFSLPGTG